MAISKEKVLDNGATGNYWKIISIFLNRITMHVHYNMGLFASKAHADVGAGLGLNKEFQTAISAEDSLGDLAAYGYNNIKGMNDPDLVGGADV